MNQKLLHLSHTIQLEYQLIFSLEREIARNETENQSLRFKIENIQGKITEFEKQWEK